jgi:hypothetical protein
MVMCHRVRRIRIRALIRSGLMGFWGCFRERLSGVFFFFLDSFSLALPFFPNHDLSTLFFVYALARIHEC